MNIKELQGVKSGMRSTMQNDIVKVCKKHGEVKNELVYVKPDGAKYCRICQREQLKNYRLKNRERFLLKLKKYRLRNLDKIKLTKKLWKINNLGHVNFKNREWCENNKEKRREISRNSAKKSVNKLSDGYIKYLMCYGTNLKRHDITPELVELKRLQIQMKRQAKEMMK